MALHPDLKHHFKVRTDLRVRIISDEQVLECGGKDMDHIISDEKIKIPASMMTIEFELYGEKKTLSIDPYSLAVCLDHTKKWSKEFLLDTYSEGDGISSVNHHQNH